MAIEPSLEQAVEHARDTSPILGNSTHAEAGGLSSGSIGAYPALLAEMLADSPVGFAFLDRELRYQHLNQSIAEFHGPPIHEHIGHRMDEIIGAPAFGALEPLLRGVLEGRSFEVPVDGRILAKATGHRHAVVYGYPVRDASADILGIGLFAIDTTNLRAAEDRRSQVDSQLQLALDAAGLGLWRFKSERVDWSRKAAELLGVDPEAPPSLDLLDSVVDAATKQNVLNAIDSALASGVAFEYELRVVWADRSVHWLLAKGQVQSTEDEGAEMVGVLADITERHASVAEDARTSARQARAGEQAVRMQRVTAALSQAATVSQVCEVLLGEGASAINAPRRLVALLNPEGNFIERVQYEGYGDSTPALASQNLEDEFPIPHCLRTGETVLLGSRDEILVRFPDFEPSLRNSVSQAVAVFPLVERGQIFGAWALVFPYERYFEEGELIILLTLAAQGAQALERARLYERERTISDSLQRTLLPQGLPNVAGLDAAVRYRPGAVGVKVGGDWYDVIRLASNRVAIIIGDVGGHNIDSASTMGQLRNAIRSYAWENHPPGRVMELTNRLICGLEPGKFATCCYVDLNLDDGIATLTTAGHPPPLVIDSKRGSYFIELPPGTPLGTTADQEYKQSTLFLTPGDGFVLYTDGLVESRTLGVPQGMQGLLNALEDHDSESPEEIAERLMHANVDELQNDDIAMVAVKFQPVKTPNASGTGRRSIHRYLPPSAASAGVARRFAADVMADWGVKDIMDQVELGVSELVTNALIHTAADVELVLRLTATAVRVEVIDHSDRMPILRVSGDEDTAGRGLHIVEAIATAWGVEPAPSGKAVWFQIQREPVSA